MKILIVDDERLVRVTLHSMLEELYPGEHEIDQAADSMEMKRFMEKKQFDLVFLDINMPRQQGLDAMAHLREEYKETQWCILTGYSYFAYAKRAIELGAKGYLLKPPNPEELKAFMEQIQKEREKSSRQNRSVFSEIVRNGIYLDDFSGISQNGKTYMLYVFFVDAAQEVRRRVLYQMMYQKLEEQTEYMQRESALFFWTTGELCLLMEGTESMRMPHFLKQHMMGCEDSILSGFSAKLADIHELKTTLKLILALAPLRLQMEPLEMLRIEKLDKDPQIMKKQYFCEQLEKLTSEFLAGDLEEFNHTLLRLTERVNEKDHFTEQIKKHLEVIWGVKFDADNMKSLLPELKSLLVKRKMQSPNALIERIQEYAEQNYMEDVSIGHMGEVFQITPTYLSRLFREKTGKKYIDYVTEIRMEKADEFLKTGKYPVKEVSKMVGYSSEKHFSRNYKKHFGFSPSQREGERS